MAEKYTKKYTLAHMLYAEGAPVLIAAGTLLEDNTAHRLLVQFRFRSLADKKIRAVRVRITLIGADGNARPANVEYLYKDLDAVRDESFGQKSAVAVAETDAASFQAAVTEVIFDDGAIWDGIGSVWLPVRSPRSLKDALESEEAARQYAIRYGSDCAFLPEEDRGLWFCTCGRINRADERKCHGCRRVYSALKKVNLSTLKTESLQRVESEMQLDSAEQAAQKARRKKQILLLSILLPILAAVIAALCIIPGRIQKKNDYESAVALLESGKYDEAQAAFAALDGYADSAGMAEQAVPYAKAVYVMECARNDDVNGLLELGLKRSDVAEGETVSIALYREADRLFEALGSYKDSEAQRVAAQAAITAYFDEQKLAAYQDASALLEENSYCAARDAFRALGSYKDSETLCQEAMYRRAVRLCELTGKYFMEGIYAKISDVTEEKSVFYIPQKVFAELGKGISSDIRDIFSKDGVEVNLEDVPEDSGCVPVCEAVNAALEALDGYKDSAELAQKALENGDFTRPFYQMCAEGNIIGAAQWLSNYRGEFAMREQWMALLQMYAPYCATWRFYQGDPTLISQSVGAQMKCEMFSSKVIIDDTTAHLVITPANAEDYPITLAASIGSTGFTLAADEQNTYYVVISNLGRFTFTKYNSYGMQLGNQSCEYAVAW